MKDADVASWLLALKGFIVQPRAIPALLLYALRRVVWTRVWSLRWSNDLSNYLHLNMLF